MKFENLGHNIRLLCLFHNIKFANLSTELSFSDSRIYDIINNKSIRITDEELEMIALFFKIPVEELKLKKAYLEFK